MQVMKSLFMQNYPKVFLYPHQLAIITLIGLSHLKKGMLSEADLIQFQKMLHTEVCSRQRHEGFDVQSIP